MQTLFYYLSVLKTKKTTQLTKCCVKRLDICKKSRQQTKCKHGRQGSQCKDCGGGHICEHNKQRSRCLFCGGNQICEHNKIKSQCKDFDPPGHHAGVVRDLDYIALKNDKEMRYSLQST